MVDKRKATTTLNVDDVEGIGLEIWSTCVCDELVSASLCSCLQRQCVCLCVCVRVEGDQGLLEERRWITLKAFECNATSVFLVCLLCFIESVISPACCLCCDWCVCKGDVTMQRKKRRPERARKVSSSSSWCIKQHRCIEELWWGQREEGLLSFIRALLSSRWCLALFASCYTLLTHFFYAVWYMISRSQQGCPLQYVVLALPHALPSVISL